ncbi:MAG: hypothetical protein NC254_10690 [bacterium]|nr:hypothetical protein [bacterium]
MNKQDSRTNASISGDLVREKKLSSKAPYLFCIFSVLVLIFSMFVNHDSFHRLVNGSVIWYQIRQVLSLLLLYAIGYAFLKVIQHHLSELWVHLLAFPTAICLWCFCSEFLLLADFTYRFWRVCFLMGTGILACYLFRRIRHIPLLPVLRTDGKTTADGALHTHDSTSGNDYSFVLCRLSSYGRIPAVVIGFCCLVSTGCIYVICNYDSYFYFSDYGKALTLMMSYKDIVSDNSFVLTNIGQFLPLVSSYMTYWGLDSGAPVLGFLIINLYAAFGVAVHEQLLPRFSAKRAACYAGISVLLLACCSVFFLFTHWILSNTYILFYLFFLFYLGKEHWKVPSVDRALLIGLYALAITMLRKDGLIIVCFVFICYSMRKLYSSFILALLFLPSAAYQLFYIYWLRHIIYAQTTLAFGTSLLSDNFMKLLLLGVVGTFFYLLFLHFLAERILKHYLPHVMTLFLIAVFGYFMMENVTTSIDYIDAWLRNFGGVGFGFCMLQILLLTTLVLLAPQFSTVDKPLRYGYTWFFVLGNILVTLIIYRQKGNTEVGIDNSGLRALYQIIPVFYYAALTTIAPLFEKPLNSNHTEVPAQKK